MKFLIDAQLPRRLAHQLRAAGFETIHTLDLPQGNRTSDQALITFSLTEHCVVVTKDSDFGGVVFCVGRNKVVFCGFYGQQL